MAITASMVKELRERSGAGMMECKKALVETDGDIEAAIEHLRKSGAAKAAKKAGRIAAEGAIVIAVPLRNRCAACRLQRQHEQAETIFIDRSAASA